MNKFITLIFIAFSVWGYAQKSVNSAYSFYGLGERHSIKNMENTLMGGISNPADSLRIDLKNPASLGRLKLTAFTFGVSSDFRKINSEKASEWAKSSKIDYISLSMPIYKNIGVSLGIQPYSSVGYKVSSEDTNEKITYEGNGGISQFYLSTGVSVAKGLEVGASVFFNFGRTNFQNFRTHKNSFYQIQEENLANYNGISYIVSAQYQQKISKKLNITTSISLMPESFITSKNQRKLNRLQPQNQGFAIKNEIEIKNEKNSVEKLIMPSELDFGLGIGSDKKWFAGVNYTFTEASKFENNFITSDFVSYKNAHRIGLGGYYIPHYNSFTRYWKRVTYRAGFYYENKSYSLRNQPINEMGISAGVSLPVYGFSNLTIGGIYGNRGTIYSNLVRENFYGLKIALTFNDKWFQKSKYN